MSTIKILSCSASYLARTSLGQIHRTTTGCLPTGIASFNNNSSSAFGQHTLTYPISCKLRLPAVKPSASSYELTKYFSNSYCTKASSPPDNKNGLQDKNSNVADQKIYATNVDDLIFGDCSNLSQFAKFKLMYKKYWYVLIPVHVTTSISWIVGFYYLSKSGFDIPSVLQSIHLSETIIEKVKDSNMGHYAIAYLCYKVITPLRYAVSLGMTTVSIKRLVLAGYIKPIPTKKEFIQMYEQKKANRAKRKEDEANNP